MIIGRILNNVHIDITTYIIILLSFLAGYFELVFLTILLIVVHELGHYISGFFLGLNVSEVRIFMFGGVTKLDECLNVSIFREIIMLLMGPIAQTLFMFIIYKLYLLGYVGLYTYEKLAFINKVLLSFNLMPILPLDGGKLLNNILDLFLSYNNSHLLTIAISIVTLPVLFIFDYKIFTIIILLFLILNIVDEIIIHKFRLNKLLLERKLNNISFKRVININNIREVKRNCSFNIKRNRMNIDEKTFYKNFFLLPST